jgi:hypothetical protein
MGMLSSTPLPQPFTFVSTLSASDCEEVIRRFRVSPPKSQFLSEKVASTSLSASNLYLTTILAGVVAHIHTLTSSDASVSEGADVLAIIAKFYLNKLEIARLEDGTKIARLAPAPSATQMPPQTTINLLPFLAAVVMFSSAEDDTRSKLSRLCDAFQFTKATQQDLTKDTIVLIIVSLFRGILVVMKDDALDEVSVSEFNVSVIETAVQKLFDGEGNECTDAHGNTTKKATMPKEAVLDWAVKLTSSLPASIENPSMVFNIFFATHTDLS